MARIAAVNAKGTRDYLPRDLVRRNHVFALLRETFERHGYEPLETPAIENTSVLEGKYGEEGERLLFRVLKRGQSLEAGFADVAAASERSPGALTRAFSDEALRYDLTVPFARVIAAHQSELVLPFRRYQMQPVWRGDRPQRGRYREFYQCDVDCVGSRSMTVDAEMAAIHYEVFHALGLRDFRTRINHRGLLSGLMQACDVPQDLQVPTLTAIDKLDKIAVDGVRGELDKLGLSTASIARLMEAISISGAPQTVVQALRPLLGDVPESEVALRELGETFGYLDAMGVPAEYYTFDVAMVRGLSYYTGTIYETVVTHSTLGSIGAGGRYDKLIGQFLGRDLPCVGISFGIDRIFDALDEQKVVTTEAATTTQVLVTLFAPETYSASFALAAQLRDAGLRTEVYADPKELKAQLSFGGKKGIPLAVILGPDEQARGEVVLRDLRGGTQESLPQAELASRAMALLGLPPAR